MSGKSRPWMSGCLCLCVRGVRVRVATRGDGGGATFSGLEYVSVHWSIGGVPLNLAS